MFAIACPKGFLQPPGDPVQGVGLIPPSGDEREEIRF